MNDRDPWEIENDAHILKRYQEIKSDPTRLADAQGFLRREIEMNKKALGKNSVSRHNNPATVGKFNFNK